MPAINFHRMRDRLSAFDFHRLFIEELGWSLLYDSKPGVDDNLKRDGRPLALGKNGALCRARGLGKRDQDRAGHHVDAEADHLLVHRSPVGQRREQPPLLRFQREDRQERHGDYQQ